MTRPRQTIAHLDRAELLEHPDNIRDDLGDLTNLALSIREHGILQPITVTEHPRAGYVILAGHRRFNAGLGAGLTSFPVIIRHGLDDHAEQIIVMLVENTQRRDLNPIEKAHAFRALTNQGLSQSEIARRIGCEPSTVNYFVSFLDLSDEAQQAVLRKEVTAGDARRAVVRARQENRVATVQPKRGRPPTYFGVTHRLFREVRDSCEHGDRTVVGQGGCGQCWEKAIVDEFVAANRRAS